MLVDTAERKQHTATHTHSALAACLARPPTIHHPHPAIARRELGRLAPACASPRCRRRADADRRCDGLSERSLAKPPSQPRREAAVTICDQGPASETLCERESRTC